MSRQLVNYCTPAPYSAAVVEGLTGPVTLPRKTHLLIKAETWPLPLIPGWVTQQSPF